MTHTITPEAVREAFAKPWEQCQCLVAKAVEEATGEKIILAGFRNFTAASGRRFEVGSGEIAQTFDRLHEYAFGEPADREAFIATFPREIEIWEVTDSLV